MDFSLVWSHPELHDSEIHYIRSSQVTMFINTSKILRYSPHSLVVKVLTGKIQSRNFI